MIFWERQEKKLEKDIINNEFYNIIFSFFFIIVLLEIRSSMIILKYFVKCN
jgi:hypothetical protein